jgi:hypothetical protein
VVAYVQILLLKLRMHFLFPIRAPCSKYDLSCQSTGCSTLSVFAPTRRFLSSKGCSDLCCLRAVPSVCLAGWLSVCLSVWLAGWLAGTCVIISNTAWRCVSIKTFYSICKWRESPSDTGRGFVSHGRHRKASWSFRWFIPVVLLINIYTAQYTAHTHTQHHVQVY